MDKELLSWTEPDEFYRKRNKLIKDFIRIKYLCVVLPYTIVFSIALSYVFYYNFQNSPVEAFKKFLAFTFVLTLFVCIKYIFELKKKFHKGPYQIKIYNDYFKINDLKGDKEVSFSELKKVLYYQNDNTEEDPMIVLIYNDDQPIMGYGVPKVVSKGKISSLLQSKLNFTDSVSKEELEQYLDKKNRMFPK